MQTPNSYEKYHAKQEHVARRRAAWEDWRAQPTTTREHQHLAFRSEQVAQLGRFVGITTTGVVQPNLFSLRHDRSTKPLVDAARDFLATLPADEQRAACFPIDAPEWRLWLNSMELRLRHGIHLEDLNQAQREGALGLLSASLSVDGVTRVRTIMRLNRILGEITGDTTILNEWRYYLSFFGTPTLDEPWGWQLDGHHLIVNCVVLPGQLVLTPCFMGAEPRISDRGPFPEARAFDREQDAGLELVRALSADQRAHAVLFPSMLSAALPPERKHQSEGRMRAGALRDNEMMPLEGISADRLTGSQRGLLVDLIGVYTGLLPAGHDSARQHEILAHFDQTYFTWIGAFDDHQPFFYKVQSPVLLVEFDHHKGVFLDNDEPERFHAHAVVRSPNGHDYGADLLRQHYAVHHQDQGPMAGWTDL